LDQNWDVGKRQRRSLDCEDHNPKTKRFRNQEIKTRRKRQEKR
jgi:hypothetical protein